MKSWLKIQHSKNKDHGIHGHGPITSWQIDGETMTVTAFIFLGSKISADGNSIHEIKRGLLLGRKVMPKSHCVDHNKLKNPSRDGNTCLLRNLYAGQEATVRNRRGITDWFQIGKGVHQCCILSPCLFNLYAEYIMQNARLDAAEAGIKIARRNINNFKYTDDTILMAESKEELNSLLMK